MSKKASKDKSCEYNNFKRARYFHGMLMTDRDFREEQIYHNEKRKLLNRMLHGWGVVCGLGIKLESEKSKITIEPGMALDCHGNEIVVCEPYEVDISSLPCQGKKTKQKQPTTPEDCEELEKTKGQFKVFYIGIRYHEVPTDPVPVYAPGGGCEERVCEYSRVREGFCIELSESFPQPQQCSWGSSLAERVSECRTTENGKVDYSEACLKEVIKAFGKEFCHEPACCPDCCPCEHYVILGTLHYNFEDKTYKVYPNKERQYVLTVPFFKYLFSTLFTGAENILPDLVDEFKDGEAPDVNLLLQNPIAALCWLTKTLLVERKEPAPSNDARVVEGFSKSEAEAHLKEKGYQVLGTVTLSEANRKELLTLSSNVKELKKDDAVEIVLDDKKKVSFLIPAREKVELKAMRDEIAELRKKLQG